VLMLVLSSVDTGSRREDQDERGRNHYLDGMKLWSENIPGHYIVWIIS